MRIVITFLIIWFISLSSSLVYSKNCPEYLTKSTAQVVILLMRFRQLNLVSRRFLILLRYLILIFSFSSVCLMETASNISKILSFLFSPAFWFFPGLDILSLPLFLFSHFSFSARHIFKSQIPFLYPSCIFLLFVLV